MALFLIGDIAKLANSIKWTLVVLMIFSVLGNFLYSCALEISLYAILGGRILCGIASASGALVYSYITATNPDRTKVTKLVSGYRTAAGVFMAILQIIAIFGSYVDFHIGSFRISSNNAPTFISSFVMIVVSITLVFTLDNARVATQKRSETITDLENLKTSTKSFRFSGALKQFFLAGRSQLLASLVVLWGMFLASFLVSEVMYFMPIFLSDSLDWLTKDQGIAFMVACVVGLCGSLVIPKLAVVNFRGARSSGTKASKDFELAEKDNDLDNAEKPDSKDRECESHHTKSGKNQMFFNQMIISLVSLFLALIGQGFMIGANEIFTSKSSSSTGTGCFFVSGLALIMAGYNGMASTFPALFSEFIKPEVKVQLMPLIGAIAALGKLVSPIVMSSLYETKLGMPIAVGLGMMLTGVSCPLIVYFVRI